MNGVIKMTAILYIGDYVDAHALDMIDFLNEITIDSNDELTINRCMLIRTILAIRREERPSKEAIEQLKAFIEEYSTLS